MKVRHALTTALFGGVIALGLPLWTPSSAEVVTISAVDSGFVTEMGGSAKGDGTIAPPATFNYSVGRELHYGGGVLGSPLVAMDRNNYFVFDLSGIDPGTIIGASLMVFAGVYESVDPFEDFALMAPMDPGTALGDAGFLLAANGVGPSAFDDPGDPAIAVAMGLYANLEGGPGPFGVTTISSLDDGTVLSIPIGPAGVDYLNAFADGLAMIGGKVVTAPPPDFPQQPFGFTGPDIPGGDPLTPILSLTIVPEPASAALLLLACAAHFGLRRVR